MQGVDTTTQRQGLPGAQEECAAPSSSFRASQLMTRPLQAGLSPETADRGPHPTPNTKTHLGGR